MEAAESTLDELLRGAKSADSVPVETEDQDGELDRLLGDQEKKSAKTEAREAKLEESKGSLKRELSASQAEIKDLRGQLERSQRVVWALVISCGVLLLGMGGTFLYAKMGRARQLEEAFRIIHYRENRALSANVIVLEDWVKRIDGLIAKVAQKDGLEESERTERIKTLTALKNNAENLKEGFLKQLSENEKERNGGGGFSYRDPFMKKEIAIEEDNGGKIDLEKLKAEVRQAANLDATMQNLEEAMLNPVPLCEQVRQQANGERQEGSLDSVDLTKGLAGANSTGIQMPGVSGGK